MALDNVGVTTVVQACHDAPIIGGWVSLGSPAKVDGGLGVQLLYERFKPSSVGNCEALAVKVLIHFWHNVRDHRHLALA